MLREFKADGRIGTGGIAGYVKAFNRSANAEIAQTGHFGMDTNQRRK